MIFRFNRLLILGCLAWAYSCQIIAAEALELNAYAEKKADSNNLSSTTTYVNNDRLIMGWLESIYLVDIPTRLRAKLDTGAKTSSVHGKVIKRFDEDGSPWVLLEFDWFRLAKARKLAELESDGKADSNKKNDQKKAKKKLAKAKVFHIKAPLVGEVKIKDHDNPSRLRPVVKLPINIAGRCHEINFTIADRKHFNYAVLLGRNFLEKAAIVDAKKTFLTSSMLEESFGHKKVTSEALKICNTIEAVSVYEQKEVVKKEVENPHKVTKN